jgi:Domain of unknown function (DUF1851)
MSIVANWREYVIAPDSANRRLLANWRELIEERRQLLFYNLFGDAFLSDANDHLLILDVGFGQLVDTEQPASQIERLMAVEGNREQWLQCGLVDHLRKSGKRPGKNECYGFSRRPPILGGQYEPENLEPILLEVHHTLLSQLHEQMRDLPQDTKIEGIEVVGEAE